MIDKASDAGPDATQAEAERPTDANGSITSNKAFWAGIGIGSAALVAALMYAKRPRTKKRF